MRDPREIIRYPLVTEKSTDVKDNEWYAFAVDRKANKSEIKDSVEKIFDVKVDRVRTLVTPGKTVKRYGKAVGKRPAVKKAYVKLKEGAIELFEGV